MFKKPFRVKTRLCLDDAFVWLGRHLQGYKSPGIQEAANGSNSMGTRFFCFPKVPLRHFATRLVTLGENYLRRLSLNSSCVERGLSGYREDVRK